MRTNRFTQARSWWSAKRNLKAYSLGWISISGTIPRVNKNRWPRIEFDSMALIEPNGCAESKFVRVAIESIREISDCIDAFAISLSRKGIAFCLNEMEQRLFACRSETAFVQEGRIGYAAYVGFGSTRGGQRSFLEIHPEIHPGSFRSADTGSAVACCFRRLGSGGLRRCSGRIGGAKRYCAAERP